MRNYGNLTCPDCGITMVKTSPSQKRCKPCALAAHGETGIGYRPKICDYCGESYIPKGSLQRFCHVCGPTKEREASTEYNRLLRREKGNRVIGSEYLCSKCGDAFILQSGPQFRCQKCLKENRLVKGSIYSKKYRQNNPVAAAINSRTGKDNYLFGGNREAALTRDNHACQKCGTTIDIHVHHTDLNGMSVPKEQRNHSLDNLTTLCRGCHISLHNRLSPRYPTKDSDTGRFLKGVKPLSAEVSNI